MKFLKINLYDFQDWILKLSIFISIVNLNLQDLFFFLTKLCYRNKLVILCETNTNFNIILNFKISNLALYY